jgi:hypothetical protein
MMYAQIVVLQVFLNILIDIIKLYTLNYVYFFMHFQISSNFKNNVSVKW